MIVACTKLIFSVKLNFLYLKLSENMFFRLIVAIVAISVAFAGAATKTTAVADTNFFQSLGDTFTDLTKGHVRMLLLQG